MARPVDYKPEYCEKVIEHMSKGLSLETFAATIGTCRATIYNWAKQFPEFLDAVNSARDLCQLFWEKKGVEGLYSYEEARFNSSVWIFNMKARFRWRDEEPKESLPPRGNAELSLEQKQILLMRAKEQIQKLEEELKTVNE